MILDITPNYELYINIMIALTLILSPFKIILGLTNAKKPDMDRFSIGDTFIGIVGLCIVGAVMVL